MVLTKDDFLRRWNSGPDGGGITNDDCADCYVAWGLGASPRTMPISKVIDRVVEAAETFRNDKEVVGMPSELQQSRIEELRNQIYDLDQFYIAHRIEYSDSYWNSWYKEQRYDELVSELKRLKEVANG